MGTQPLVLPILQAMQVAPLTNVLVSRQPSSSPMRVSNSSQGNPRPGSTVWRLPWRQ